MKQTTKKRVAIGTGAAAAAAALGAAAYYFYGSKDAKKNRKKASAWMRAAEREVMTRARALKDAAFTEENYKKIVREVAKKYKEMEPDEVAAFVAGLTKAWKDVKRDLSAASAAPKRPRGAKRGVAKKKSA